MSNLLYSDGSIPYMVKFKELRIGQEFECYGDTFINYDYPKICRCRKLTEDTAEEIDGITFSVDGTNKVFLIKSKK